jgi:hypothetical protein
MNKHVNGTLAFQSKHLLAHETRFVVHLKEIISPGPWPEKFNKNSGFGKTPHWMFIVPDAFKPLRPIAANIPQGHY